MIQKECVINNIETLVTRSRNIVEIDTHVTEAIIQHRRGHLLNTLRECIELVNQSGERTMTAWNIPETRIFANND